MKNLVLSVALCCTCAFASAQSLSSQVIAATGYYLETPAGSLSYTVAEHMGNTFQASNLLTVHQGFQSPAEPVATITGLGEENSGFKIYPNPVVNHLYIERSEGVNVYSFRIIDVSGREIAKQNSVFESSTDVDMSRLSAGVYFLIIRDPLGNSRSTSILKTK